jgi:drug/metabolite transporter (DMT)-like permease
MFSSGYFYLVIIYVIWGTTYLAMRIGITSGSGFPVFAFGATRCLIASAILFLIALFRRQTLRLSVKETFYLILTGVGMWTAAHGLVLAAEQTIDSGFAAVAVSASPLWVLLLSSLWDRTLPDFRRLLFIGIGFAGVAALIVPALQKPGLNSAEGLLLLALSPISWAFFALYLKRKPLTLSVFTVSAYQHLFGGLGFLVLSLFWHEPMPTPTAAAWGALAFLVIFGSVIAFTAYVKALSLLPAYLVTTNTYVNPIIAVILGWIILREALTPWTFLAIALVIISVSGTIPKPKPRLGACRT